MVIKQTPAALFDDERLEMVGLPWDGEDALKTTLKRQQSVRQERPTGTNTACSTIPSSAVQCSDALQHSTTFCIRGKYEGAAGPKKPQKFTRATTFRGTAERNKYLHYKWTYFKAKYLGQGIIRMRQRAIASYDNLVDEREGKGYHNSVDDKHVDGL